MGDRVRVVHDDEGRLVAITSPPPDDPDRGRRVAALLEGLHHPGVAEVLALVDHADGPELHTRWVGSRSLTDVARPLAPERAAGLVLAVAATVADLHRLGVVHGAIDPSHVLLDPFGRPVLCGFGSARRLGEGPAGADQARPSTDVAGLGQLLRTLLTPPAAAATHGPARSDRARRPRREVARLRALLAVAGQATNADPTCRPGVRAFIDGVRAAAPTAALGRPPESTEPDGLTSAPGRSGPEMGAGSTDRDQPGPTEPRPSRRPDPLATLLADVASGPSAPPGPPSVTEVRIDAPTASAPGAEHGPVPGEAPPHPSWRDLARLRPRDDDAHRSRRRPVGVIGTLLAIAGLSVSTFLGLSAWWGTPSPAIDPIGAALDDQAAPLPTAGPTTLPTISPTNTTTPTTTPAPVLEHAGRRFQVGSPGDLAVVGDWSCEGEPQPALYRPSTGSVFVFPAWPEPGLDTATTPSTSTVTGGVSVTVGPLDVDGCPSLVVSRADGPPVTLTKASWA